MTRMTEDNASRKSTVKGSPSDPGPDSNKTLTPAKSDDREGESAKKLSLSDVVNGGRNRFAVQVYEETMTDIKRRLLAHGLGIPVIAGITSMVDPALPDMAQVQDGFDAQTMSAKRKFLEDSPRWDKNLSPKELKRMQILTQ